MRMQDPIVASDRKMASRGFTLAEVMIAVLIIVMVVSTIVLAYTQAAYRAEWTGYSLAAESLGVKQIEQARSAVWDPASATNYNQVYMMNLTSSNYSSGVLTGYTWTNLDLPSTGTNYERATNYVSIRSIGASGVTNIMIRVDTVWRFRWRGMTKLYTNSIAT